MARAIFFLGLMLMITADGLSQVPDVGNLFLSGKVVNQKKRGMSAEIYVYKNGVKQEQFSTNRIGRFSFSIPLQDSVAFVVLAEGYVSKTVYVDAMVDIKRQEADFNFPFFIDLYPVGRTPSNIDLERPVGKIIFSGSQFIYDIDFTNRQNKLLKEFVRERKELKVRERTE